MRFSLLLLFVAILPACSDRPEGASSVADETFVELHADLLVLREQEILSGGDSTTIRMASDSLMASRGYTTEQYEIRLSHYRENPATWRALHEQVVRVLEARHRLRQGAPRPPRTSTERQPP